MARYMAPVSTYTSPNRLATSLATVLLPAPAGPSFRYIPIHTIPLFRYLPFSLHTRCPRYLFPPERPQKYLIQRPPVLLPVIRKPVRQFLLANQFPLKKGLQDGASG